MSKRESEFLTELKHSFRERGAFFFKIPDMPHFAGSKAHFDIKKPFDAFGAWQGQAFAIEAKVMKDWTKFGIKNLRQNQIDGLNAWEKAGVPGFVFVQLRRQRRAKNAQSPINRLYIFSWKEIKEKGSWSKAEMVARGRYLPRYKGSLGLKAKLGHYYRYNVDVFLVSLFTGTY